MTLQELLEMPKGTSIAEYEKLLKEEQKLRATDTKNILNRYRNTQQNETRHLKDLKR